MLALNKYIYQELENTSHVFRVTYAVSKDPSKLFELYEDLINKEDAIKIPLLIIKKEFENFIQVDHYRIEEIVYLDEL